MTVWIALVVGILIGWIIEWIIDWLYWRRNLAGFYATETQLRRQLAAAEDQLTELMAKNNALRVDLKSASSEQLSALEAATKSGDEEFDNAESDSTEIDVADVDGAATNEELDSAETETADADGAAEIDATDAVVAAAVRAAVASSAATSHPDDLTKISGIGPVYRRKLHEAGIYTFDQLAAASPDQLDTAVAPEGFQKPAFEQWIDDAGKLVAGAGGVESADAANISDTDEER